MTGESAGASDIASEIVDLWSAVNPVAGYTGGHLDELTALPMQTAEAVEAMRARIGRLRAKLPSIPDDRMRQTAAALLTSLETQLALPRPSGSGPSGTGMGGVYAAADGIFYIVLKQDYKAGFVAAYLDAVVKVVEFETRRWWGQDFTILVRRECLDTAAYMEGTIGAVLQLRPDLADQCAAIRKALERYRALFALPGLDSADFATYWPIFQAWDHVRGPVQARGYPACLQGYYQLTETADQIEVMAQAWLDLDLPVVASLVERVVALPFVGEAGSLQDVWDKVSDHYAVDFGKAMDRVVSACNDYGARYLIAHTAADRVEFAATPDYLTNLVTGGEDFAVNYLDPASAYSQLYLTAAKNTSLLTMINILVHEASHGFNFVLSAKQAGSPLLNLNTALEVPLTEGMAFWREFEYWAAAQRLLGAATLDGVEQAYLDLYGESADDQAAGVLCAELETYIWRIVRYVRALCDVRVNGGKMTYTDFIAWAAGATGLSAETLHGECFTFMASPGYAPCYAVGGAAYAALQARQAQTGVSAIDFNTFASKSGFYAWPLEKQLLSAPIPASAVPA
jgi:hypothetical protein